MPEMIVNAPEVKRTVEDYDFTFNSGMTMPVTVDTAAGDTVTFGDVVLIHLSEKPSLNDADRMLPAEDITIYPQHLVVVQRRTRDVIGLNPEQQHEWLRTLKEVTKSIQ